MGIVASKYLKLSKNRLPYLNRARKAAKYTIPSLIPPEGTTGSTDIENPYQSLGARGVNNLSSKLSLALIPPNTPFYRYDLSEDLKETVTEKDKSLVSKIEEQLSRREIRLLKEISKSGDRVSLGEAFKHLLVAGNVLLETDMTTGKVRYIPLSSFCIKRDSMGNVLEIIIKESISPKVLPKEVFDSIRLDPSYKEDEDVEIYTYCYRDRENNRWVIYQEAFGIKIEETEGWYPIEYCPYIALRYTAIANEDYGRGYIEEHLGDLIAYTGLRKAMVKGSLAAARIIYMVRHNGTVRKSDLVKAESGDVIDGHADDVSTLQLDKYYDFNIANKEAETIKQDLSSVFLLFTELRRDAERVTTEETRQVVKEIEESLGNFYAVLSQDFQYNYIRQKEYTLIKNGTLPRLPKGMVDIAIITGVEALGRGNDLNKLDNFIAGTAQVIGAETVARYINPSEYLQRRATALGLDKTNLVKDEEELKAEAAQQQQMATMSQLSPELIKQFGGMVQNQQKVNLEQQAQGANNGQ